MPYEDMRRGEDARFQQAGIFGEARVPMGEQGSWVLGGRMDRWRAEDHRATVAVGMMGSMTNPTSGRVRSATLTSGFARYEHLVSGHDLTVYAGLGRSERFPDYWELFNKETPTSLSAFEMKPERTTQLDVGILGGSGVWTWSASLFGGRVNDYLLVRSGFMKGMRAATVIRNVDASTWGGEADLQWRPAEGWKVYGTLAHTHGRNRSDDRFLGQQPPLEARLGVDRNVRNWSAGLLIRSVARQNRFALAEGNIVGQDLGATAGFTVLSLNAAWRSPGGTRISAGIDNLLDRAYAEHLSRGGAMLAGYEAISRVPEAGRTWWLRAEVGRR